MCLHLLNTACACEERHAKAAVFLHMISIMFHLSLDHGHVLDHANSKQYVSNFRYLHPLEHDTEQQHRVSRELKALRNKVALGFFMINCLFVLIVFLLQLRKDELHIVWPIGFRTNLTWVNCTSVFGMAKGLADPAMYGLLASLTKNLSALPLPVETTLCPKTELVYLKLEPIGVVFVFFFLLILVIQFIAMLFHRFGTISHILASTDLFCCRPNIKDISDDEFIERNAVEIARALQALRGIDEDELMSMESGEMTGGGGSSSEEGDPSVRNRNRHMIQHLENHRRSRAKTRTLDVAFRKRFQVSPPPSNFQLILNLIQLKIKLTLNWKFCSQWISGDFCIFHYCSNFSM